MHDLNETRAELSADMRFLDVAAGSSVAQLTNPVHIGVGTK